MATRSRVAALLLLGLLAACGSEVEPTADDATAEASATDEPTTSAPEETGSAEPSEPAKRPKEREPRTREQTKSGTRIVTGGSQFGRMLFDAAGQAIYLFDIEPTSRSRCYGECAVAWPPVLTQGDPVAGKGVNGTMLGTTERRDGTVQVTYNDHPLYYYAHEGPREVRCHDVFLNGGNWYVVQPDGDAAPPG